jgi:transcriptional regulator with XRE-family HTH domain
MNSRAPKPPDAESGSAPQTSDTDFAAALGRAIKVFRTGLGIGRRELAGAADLSYSYLTEIENGKKQASATAQKAIAAALGMSVSKLLAAAEQWAAQLAAEREGESAGQAIDYVARSAPPEPDLHRKLGLEPPAGGLRDQGARRRQLRWFNTSARRAAGPEDAASADEEAASAAELRSVESCLAELRLLLSRMEAGDRERVVDLARRLVRG